MTVSQIPAGGARIGEQRSSVWMEQLLQPGWTEDVLARLRLLEPKILVGNEWIATESGRTVDIEDPSTGNIVATTGVATPADVDNAVNVAAAAQPAWAAMTMNQRIDHIFALRDLIVDNAALLSTVDAIDAGLPVARMLADIENIQRVTRGYAALATNLRGEVVEGLPGIHFTRHQPFGVVARIVAFNHPLLFAVKGSLAALLAGNAVVLKPADQTPLSALVLGELISASMPPGIFNIITGDAETGSSLVTHPKIRRIAFTGSVRVGRMIQEAAARDQIRNVSLELGGKNPMIVFGDADVEAVASEVIYGMNLRANQGQSCGSTSRIYVHRSIYDQVVAVTGAKMDTMTLGPAFDPDMDMGPMITTAAAERVRSYIESGVADGARLVSGGTDDPRAAVGSAFVAPTLFADVPATARIAREEIFGPVVAMFAWDDIDQVIEEANALEYGLTASVWTNDLNLAMDTANRLETGYVWINESTTHYFGTPFGGWKDSGVGREESIEELYSFLQPKSIHIKMRK